MSSILETITELGLRRLYKFILKRVLSPILLDDLSLEQISLVSRDGTIQLTDLALQCSYLNEYLAPLPIRVRSCRVASIKAKVSYTNILEDGISFEVSGVAIELEPAPEVSTENSTRPQQPSSSLGAYTSQQHGSHEAQTKDAEVEGLKFIASWVEIIIAKLTVSVSDIKVSVYDSSKAILFLVVKKAQFYNAHPQDRVASERSVDLSTRFQGDRSSIQSLGKRKHLNLSEIEVTVIDWNTSLTYSIFKTSGLVTLHLTSSLNRFGALDLDLDLCVPELRFTFCSQSLLILLSLWSIYIFNPVHISEAVDKATSSSSMLQFLRHLDKLEGKEEDSEIDFERLERLMEQYRSALTSLEAKSLNCVNIGGTVIDDDGSDFPVHDDDDEDDDDDDDGRSARGVSFKSSLYDKSLYGEESLRSVMFKSAVEGPADAQMTTGVIHCRIHIITIEADVNLREGEEPQTSDVIHFKFDTVILDFRHSALSTKATCSLSSVDIMDATSQSHIVDFFVGQDNRRVIIPPNVELEAIIISTSPVVNIKLNLEPMVFFVNPHIVSNITNFLSAFSIVQGSQPSNVTYYISVNSRHVEVVLLNNESRFFYFSDILKRSSDSKVVSLNRQAQRWERSLPTFLQGKLQKSCGFRISVASLSLSLTVPSGGQLLLDAIQFFSVQIFLFLVTDDTEEKKLEFQLLVFDMSSSSDRKIAVSFNQETLFAQRSLASEKTDQFTFPQFDPPMGALAHSFLIECKKIVLDVWDSEYVFCMDLFIRLNELMHDSLPAAPQPQPVNSISFGFQIRSEILIVNLSKIVDNQMTSASLSVLNQESVASYCLSSQRMVFSILVEEHKTNLRLSTMDFSLFESEGEFPGRAARDRTILSRTSFLPSSDKDTDDFESRSAFSCCVLLSDEMGVLPCELVQHLAINLSLFDVSWYYDPTSNWIMNVASILGGESKDSSAKPDLAKTQVYISVSKCIIDYNCGAERSRLLHSVGTIQVSTNLASSSKKMGFKFVLKDLDSYISNRVLSDMYLEPSTLDVRGVSTRRVGLLSFESFLDTHGFKSMYNIDTCELRLLYNCENGSMTIETSIGFLSLIGCIDSYDALARTLTYLWSKVKPASPASRPLEETNEESQELIPETADSTQLFEYFAKIPTVVTSIYSLGDEQEDGIVENDGLDAVIYDNFYKSTSLDLGGPNCESKAQWFANYDYDDDDNLGDDNLFQSELEEEEEDESGEEENQQELHFGEDDDSDRGSSYTSSVRSASKLAKGFGYDSIQLLDLEMDEMLRTTWTGAANLDNVVDLNLTMAEAINEKVQAQDEARDEFESSLCGDATENVNTEIRQLGHELEDRIHSQSDLLLVHTLDTSKSPHRKVYEHNILHNSSVFLESGPVERLARSGYCDDDLDDEDQVARWYPGQVGLNEALITNHMRDFSEEKTKNKSPPLNALPEIFVSLKLCIRFCLHGGSDGHGSNHMKTIAKKGGAHVKSLNKSLFDADMPPVCGVAHTNTTEAVPGRGAEDILEISAKDVFFEFRLLQVKQPRRNIAIDEVFEILSPHQFVSAKIQDVLISFARKALKKRKVLGRWKGPHSDAADAAIILTMSTGYGKGTDKELHILTLQVVPIRCYLDWYLISFIKKMVSKSMLLAEERKAADSSIIVEDEEQADVVFFLFRVFSIKARIDFKCGNFNVDSLRHGDYSQMLNIFPLDGLEITLQQIDLRRAVGFLNTIHKSLEIWVNDIYERQLHRVISGAAPFRGLSKVGDGLHDLIFIPMSEFKKHGFDKNFLRSIRQSAASFLYTMTTEALHASHQLTMMVANSIKDLVSEDGAPTSPILTRQQPEGIKESLTLAYGALQRELGTAAETIVAVPIKQYERTGAGGYMRSVIRAMPIAVLRPAAGVTEAISYTLLGLRNHLNPEAKTDADDEWNAEHSVFLSA